jgi:hypothetical protein
VGVRKQIETNWDANAVLARVGLYDAGCYLYQKAVENSPKTVESLTISNSFAG